MEARRQCRVPRSNHYNLYYKRCITTCFLLNHHQRVLFSSTLQYIHLYFLYFFFSSSFYSSLLPTSLEYLFIEPKFLQQIPVQWFLFWSLFSLNMRYKLRQSGYLASYTIVSVKHFGRIYPNEDFIKIVFFLFESLAAH